MGVKSYPETSAQHHALWSMIMLAMIRKKPLEAERYLGSAETCAELALAAPVAEPTQTGVKPLQETTGDDGAIGLRLSGFATVWGETDLAGEVMRSVRRALAPPRDAPSTCDDNTTSRTAVTLPAALP